MWISTVIAKKLTPYVQPSHQLLFYLERVSCCGLIFNSDHLLTTTHLFSLTFSSAWYLLFPITGFRSVSGKIRILMRQYQSLSPTWSGDQWKPQCRVADQTADQIRKRQIFFFFKHVPNVLNCCLEDLSGSINPLTLWANSPQELLGETLLTFVSQWAETVSG